MRWATQSVHLLLFLFAVALSIICAMSLSFVLIDQQSDTPFSSRGYLDKENRYSSTLTHHSSHPSSHNPFPLLSQRLLFLLLWSYFPTLVLASLPKLASCCKRHLGAISHRNLQEVQEEEKTPKKKISHGHCFFSHLFPFMTSRHGSFLSLNKADQGSIDS
ncbi:MAG: hypothetical protein JOS17DRAFT_556684 [Linnemannia elongata]|nr:MAG: hypothetical protein JOS17DRAFT_556684 [Linnemannia elongata]